MISHLERAMMGSHTLDARKVSRKAIPTKEVHSNHYSQVEIKHQHKWVQQGLVWMGVTTLNTLSKR